ncbi:MAG: hypothetical protein ACFCGT_00060 [Sandaracinaceae bacterium]
MATITCHHEDRWGAILEYPELTLMEIRWYDTTADMSGEDFNAFLATFASTLEKATTPRCLVDGTCFRMDPSRMSMGWRDEHIIPRYNAAGVRKFAFHMPAGMPAIGAPPRAEGPATFPTAYFGAREDALAWLLSD